MLFFSPTICGGGSGIIDSDCLCFLRLLLFDIFSSDLSYGLPASTESGSGFASSTSGFSETIKSLQSSGIASRLGSYLPSNVNNDMKFFLPALNLFEHS